MVAGKDWDRLAEFTRERRVDLGMTQEDARAAGGPSTATMRLIEGALQRNYHPATLRDLEKALRWERGSVARILAGRDPVPVTDSPPPQTASSGPSPFTVLADRLGLDLDPYRRAIQQRIDAAQEAFPGEVPPGSLIFDDPEMAAQWDLLAAREYADGQRFTTAQLRDAFATRLAQRGNPRRNIAAGLTAGHQDITMRRFRGETAVR